MSSATINRSNFLSPNRILSIDWDYITGDCYRSSCDAHCGFCTASNSTRGSESFLDVVWEEKERRVLGLNIPKGAFTFVAECHASIVEIFKYFDGKLTIYDYDSHYDYYNSSEILDCANWIHHLSLQNGGEVLSRPRKIKDVAAVFLCLSSPWTPRSMDDRFFEFIHKLYKKTKVLPIFIGHKKCELTEGFEKAVDRIWI